MSEPVKPRTYRSSVREEQARRTRLAILGAARLLFTEQGYAATTIAQVAAKAGVAVDTVYAAVGTKPVLTRLLMETAISGTDQAVPAEERDYVQQIRAAGAASEKIRIYAAAVTDVNSRVAPLHLMMRDAAAQAPELGSSGPRSPPGGPGTCACSPRTWRSSGNCGQASTSTRSPMWSGA